MGMYWEELAPKRVVAFTADGKAVIEKDGVRSVCELAISPKGVMLAAAPQPEAIIQSSSSEQIHL